MTRYKLKKAARQFFDKKLHEEIKPLEFWNKKTISANLLDEVDKVYIDFGIKRSESTTDLKGWNNNNEDPNAHFHFTVYVNDMQYVDYKNIEIAEVMDEIQKVLNVYFKNQESY